jgi:transaldolase
MKFFIDSADLDEIRDLASTGLIDGATTNPSLVAKSGAKFEDIIAEICQILSGPVSAEVTALDADTMVVEGRKLAKIADNVTIKVPLTPDGLKACKVLTGEGTKVNVTLCFSAGQAILAAKAGATFVSPFVGRLDDIGLKGMDLIDEICTIYRAQEAFETEVLVASIRSVGHVIEAASPTRGSPPSSPIGKRPANRSSARPTCRNRRRLNDRGPQNARPRSARKNRRPAHGGGRRRVSLRQSRFHRRSSRNTRFPCPRPPRFRRRCHRHARGPDRPVAVREPAPAR